MRWKVLSYERHARSPEVCASAMSLVMVISQLPKNNVQPGDVWEQTHRGGSASDAEMRRLSHVRMRMQLL